MELWSDVRPNTPILHHSNVLDIASIELRVGELIARIGDNAAEGAHRAGYNGVWSLTTTDEKENLFVPAVAGLNFEHIFDGHVGRRDVLFEPRNAPMELRQIANNEVELHQPPTPFWHLESWTRFELVAPHFIEMTFRCIPRQHTYNHGYIGLFWASYINAPENKAIYFWGRREGERSSRWLQLCTQYHDDESTVVHVDEPQLRLKISDGHPPMLFTNYSALRYEEPLMFGRWKDKVFAVMFDRTEGLRLAHSPSGGGGTPDGQDTNPAWDWQFIIPNYDVNKEYGFKARAVFKKFAGREELRKMLKEWRP